MLVANSAVPELSEFVRIHRDEIIARTVSRVSARPATQVTDAEQGHGVPLFLDQLAASLRAEAGADECSGGAASSREIAIAAALHGRDLLGRKFTIAQVVQDYGGVCQAITELAIELDAPISSAAFRTLNRCLDEAIAGAVSEYSRLRERSITEQSVERLGMLAHDLRNELNTAILSFEALKSGAVGISGSTGSLLGRSLTGLRDLIDRSLAEVRLEAGIQTKRRTLVAQLIEDIEVSATMDAKDHNLELTVFPVTNDLAVHGDPQILASVLSNLLQNAFKFTRTGGHVSLRTTSTSERVMIEVEDQCGGLPPGQAEELFQPFVQRGVDRTGLGLGLAISRRGAEASGGQLYVRNLPGSGCVFVVDLPRQPAPL
jgi:signal transduction histidine kinase